MKSAYKSKTWLLELQCMLVLRYSKDLFLMHYLFITLQMACSNFFYSLRDCFVCDTTNKFFDTELFFVVLLLFYSARIVNFFYSVYLLSILFYFTVLFFIVVFDRFLVYLLTLEHIHVR